MALPLIKLPFKTVSAVSFTIDERLVLLILEIIIKKWSPL